MAKERTKKVLVIGWDAADWKVIEPLMQQGKMPALKKFMEEGVYGRIQTLDPPLSPMLWTSIATGFRADRHGIGGFIEPLPDGSGLRPVTTTSRKVKAIWNILNQVGKRSNVVAWWPSNPAEPINGVMVSNLYQVANKPLGKEWEMPKGTIHPESMIDELKDLRVHPQEISMSMAAPFIPELAKNKELKKEKRSIGIAKVIAHAASVHSASTHLMEKKDWDFMAVYHDAIDHFCHLTMRFHPPRRPQISEEDFNTYSGVVEAGYRFHDMMLERTMELIDDDTTVILLSDHGFHSDHQRPLYIPNEPSGPAVEHSPYGIIAMRGPGIKKGGIEISGTSVLDITPTILALYGLPVGKDMEGKVIYQAFEDVSPAEYIESWEKVEGDHGMHSKEQQEDPWAAQEALQQLVELGYIDPLDENVAEQVAKAKRESDYYVARNMINGGRILQAVEVLERIFEESKITRYGQRLAFAYLELKWYLKCQSLIKELRILEKENQKKTLERAKKQKAEGKKLLYDDEHPIWREEVEEPLYLDYLEALLLLAINQPWKAEPILKRVQKKNLTNPDVSMNIGKIFLMRKKFAQAEKEFIRALAIDDRSAQAHHGLGLAYLRRNKTELALDEFLTAIQQNFYVPTFHYHLGETLARMNDFENAAQAFEVAIRLTPGMAKAHKWLQKIYSEELNDPKKAEHHQRFLEKNIRGEVVIVTGLPNSGAVTVLKMLQAGGHDILVNSGEDLNDTSKPEQEYSLIVKLRKDKNAISEARDKAMKVFVQNVMNLPEHYTYKVIFVHRNLDEIVAQQKKIMSNVKKNALPMDALYNFQEQLNKMDNWISANPNVRKLTVEFNDLNEFPIETSEVIADFIGKDLNIKAMGLAFNEK